MINEHLPFEYLASLRKWIDKNVNVSPQADNERILQKELKDIVHKIDVFREFSAEIPEELLQKQNRIESLLVANQENEVLKKILLDLDDLSKQIKRVLSRKRLLTHKRVSPAKKLKISFSDGDSIIKKNATQTYVDGLRHMGLDRLSDIKAITQKGYPIVSKERPVNSVNVKMIDGYYVQCHGSTDAKARYLERYAEILEIDIKVEVD